MVKRHTIATVPTPPPSLCTYTCLVLEEVHQRKFRIYTMDALITHTGAGQCEKEKSVEVQLSPGPNRENKHRCHLASRKLTSFHG